MIENQRIRRHMNRFQWAEVVLKRKESIAAKAKANQKAGGGAVRTKSSEPVRTIEKLAKLARMGSTTLKQVAFILKHADQKTIEKMRKGDPNYSINSVHDEFQELVSKKRTTKSLRAKPKQRKCKSASPTELPQDLAGQIIASLEELELQYPELHDRIDFYNTVSDWVHKKKVELTLSQKKLS
jgi:hypothetical protein